MKRETIEFFKIYESLRIPYFGGIWYKFMNKIDLKVFDKLSIPQNPLNTEKREETIICSLTSFPARIEYAHLTIKSLMLQTYKPDRIVLWLAEEQFPDKKLPQSLIGLEEYGLEIRWCEHNIYGHKKYFYALQEQRENELVITFDDDIMYSPRCIERLVKTHIENPDCMVCERAQAVNKTLDKIHLPGRWDTISNIGVSKPSYSLCPSTGGGCLIPYKTFPKEAFNVENIKNLSLRSDDIWNMYMCAINHKRIIKTRKYHRIFTTVLSSQETSLSYDNIINRQDEVCMLKLKEAYPEAYERIMTDKD